jgi:blue copper oxidase
MRRRSRRFLVGGLVTVGVLVGGLTAAGTWAWVQAKQDTVGQVDFSSPLAIPPLAESTVDADGRRVFELTAEEGRHDFGGGPASTFGFNGDYLGPTLRARRGEQVAITVNNELDETTTVHWHGMRLPATMDGGPHQPIDPGEAWSPTWTIDQPAATLWYHPHPHGQTERHVYRGLAGMFIVDDDETDALGLPGDYGVDDIPVIVQDKRLDSAGRLTDSRSFLSDSGLLGDTIAVNGTVGPYLDVTTELVRLRVLNGSTARSYDFGFDDNRVFALVASDGGLLTEPHHTGRIMLSPGERAEIVVAMSPGEQTVLRSYPPDLGLGAFDRFFGGDDSFDVLQLRAADDLESRPAVPGRLADIAPLDPTDAAATRSFRLSGRTINGERMDMNRIDAVVGAGSAEVWEVSNADGAAHNFHIHDVQFQVLSVAGQAPPPELAGWKDTVYLRPNTPIRLIARFSEHDDPDTPYMFHCHLLAHEDGGMMGQFVVVADLAAPPVPSSGGVDHTRHG